MWITILQAIDENIHVTSDDKVSTNIYRHYWLLKNNK
jgi:hypothetical protein